MFDFRKKLTTWYETQKKTIEDFKALEVLFSDSSPVLRIQTPSFSTVEKELLRYSCKLLGDD